METQKKIISTLVLIVAVLCLCLYYIIFVSSFRFEQNKTLVNQGVPETSVNRLSLSEFPSRDAYWFQKAVINNPAETELFLRSKLLESQLPSIENVRELKLIYGGLLDIKPTWPYYFSGIVQLSMVDGSLDKGLIESAIKYGSYEKKVIKSLAEVLFYHWDNLTNEERNRLLNYLSNQTEATISQVVLISANFARIYEYCDFLYDKKHVEYAACKRQYWQPLSKVE